MDKLTVENAQKREEKSVWNALSLAWELGYTISIPIVIFGLLGRLVDHWLKTSPWFLLLGIFVSIIISSMAVYFKTIKILAETEAIDKKGGEIETEKEKL